MIEGVKVLAVIPARSGSKGLADKNVKPLQGRPLLGWPIQAAKGCDYIDKVVCSTDSVRYQHIALKEGALVPFLRPPTLSGDKATSVPVALHAWNQIYGAEEDGYLVLLEPTSPLTESIDLNNALAMLREKTDRADAIVGISHCGSAHPAFCTYLNDDNLLLPFHDYQQQGAPRRQDVAPVYFFDGSFYISKVSALRQRGTFYHERSLGYPMDKWKSLEVDSLADFIMIEALLDNLDKLSLNQGEAK